MRNLTFRLCMHNRRDSKRIQRMERLVSRRNKLFENSEANVAVQGVIRVSTIRHHRKFGGNTTRIFLLPHVVTTLSALCHRDVKTTRCLSSRSLGN